MLTYQEIRENETVRTYIRLADESLAALGLSTSKVKTFAQPDYAKYQA